MGFGLSRVRRNFWLCTVVVLISAACGNVVTPSGECRGTINGRSIHAALVAKGSEYWRENVLDQDQLICATGEYFYALQTQYEDDISIGAMIMGDISTVNGTLHREYPSSESVQYGVKYVRIRIGTEISIDDASGAIVFERGAFAALSGTWVPALGREQQLECSFVVPEGEPFRSTHADRCQ